MKNLKIAFSLTALLTLSFVLYNWSGEAQANNESFDDEENPTQIDGYTIESAITVQNLQVFLISGEDELKNKKYTSLSTAMDNKLVTVQETGSVNELAIDNNSDSYIFIHSGDIVKGGKQDRTMAYDVIIPPNAKNVALQSFCVENGRWQARGTEEVSNFNSTKNMLSSRDLKMAAKYDGNQSKVWSNVDTEQKKLNDNVSRINGYDVDVKSTVSTTSLQLALESKELEKAKSKMTEQLKNLLSDHPKALGYAYAINGEIYGVDIYNNRALFHEIWSKVSESIIIEAIANSVEEEYTKANIANVAEFMNAVKSANPSETKKEVNSATEFQIKENKNGDVLFSTIDNSENKWIHKNYMKVISDDTEILRNEQINLIPEPYINDWGN